MNKMMRSTEQEERMRNAKIDAWFDTHFHTPDTVIQEYLSALKAELKQRLSEPTTHEETL